MSDDDDKTVLDAARDDDVYVWSSYNKDEPEAGQSLSYGDLSRVTRDMIGDDDVVFVMPAETTGSDYSGGTHNKANQKAMLADFAGDDVHEVYGGHGTFAFAVRATNTDESLIEAIEALQDYPVYSDDALSEHEMELQEEAWENWASSDYTRALAKLHNDVDDWEEAVEALEAAGALSWAFHDMADQANEYWESDGPNMHIDVDKVAEVAAPGALLDTHGPNRGWLGHTLADTAVALIQMLNGIEPDVISGKLADRYNFATSRRLRAVLNGLYDEGVQPKFVLGAASEWSLLKELNNEGIDPKKVIALADKLGEDADEERRYEELANRFLVLDDAYRWSYESVDRFRDLDGDRSDPDIELDAEFLANNYDIIIEAMKRTEEYPLFEKDHATWQLTPKAAPAGMPQWVAANPVRRRAS
jgi:hypothetical protein